MKKMPEQVKWGLKTNASKFFTTFNQHNIQKKFKAFPLASKAFSLRYMYTLNKKETFLGMCNVSSIFSTHTIRQSRIICHTKCKLERVE